MDTSMLKARWDQATGSLKEQYGKITGDDIVAAEGKVENLAAKLKVKYELTEDTAQEKAQELMDSLKD